VTNDKPGPVVPGTVSVGISNDRLNQIKARQRDHDSLTNMTNKSVDDKTHRPEMGFPRFASCIINRVPVVPTVV
jgi:hypothetical protein